LQRQEQEHQEQKQRHSYAVFDDESLDNAYEMTKGICNVAAGCDRCSPIIGKELRKRGYRNQDDNNKIGALSGHRLLATTDDGGNDSNTPKSGRSLVTNNLQMSFSWRETAYLVDDTSDDGDTYHSLHPSRP
jgi:hypothetical protein